MPDQLLAKQKASALIEALPYFQAFRGQTFLIKMGGAAMENESLVNAVMKDIVFLELAGINPVVVHGGGKAISSAIMEAGVEPNFINGLRQTNAEVISIVERTLNESVNPTLVKMLIQNGGRAQGLAGQTVFSAEKYVEGGDLGFVGTVTECDTTIINRLVREDVIPVISPLGRNKSTGELYNVNADLSAAALAETLQPAKLIYLSDVPGLMRDPQNSDTLIHSINQSQASDLIEEGVIKGGMLPKVESALKALRSGVNKIHFIDGRNEHSLLLEIFTASGVGTEIVKE